MRVTNQMLASQMTANVTGSASRMYRLQNQVASGKKITQASDDPLGASQSMNLRSSVSSVEQYQRNTADAKARLATVDASLNNLTRALQESKRLALAGSTGTVDDTQRKAYAEQLDQQIAYVIQEANTSYKDGKLFSGGATGASPIGGNPSLGTPYTYQGDDKVAQVQVNDTTTLEVGVTAKQLLNFDGATDPAVPDTLTVLTNLRDALKANDTGKTQAAMKQLESGLQNVILQRGKMGARGQQVELYASRLDDTKLALNAQVSNIEDVDLAEAMVQLQTEQNAYQASLLATARMSQSSLADYLK